YLLRRWSQVRFLPGGQNVIRMRRKTSEAISQHQFPPGTGLMKFSKRCCRPLLHLLCHMEIKVLAQRFCEEAKHFRGYTDHTIRRYRTTVELFCKQAGVADTASVTPEAVRDWFFHGRSERTWSAQ